MVQATKLNRLFPLLFYMEENLAASVHMSYSLVVFLSFFFFLFFLLVRLL